MNCRILITGSSGLVGGRLCTTLPAHGASVERLDLRASGRDSGDVRDVERVRRAMSGCDGVIHLAAVSRVVWGERDPEQCLATNVDGTRNVLQVAAMQTRRPWILFVSSREVYGHPSELPVTEDAPLQPVNVYGRSKLSGERLVEGARRDGLRAAIVRLSNVFGSTTDHVDRVVPAFARAAVAGLPIRVDGVDHTFDFTHLDDAARGIVALVRVLLDGGATPPPIHLVTGEGTTLMQLATLAVDLAASSSPIRVAPPRDFDVARFRGSPERAKALLGWAPRIPLRDGLARFIDELRIDLRDEHDAITDPRRAP